MSISSSSSISIVISMSISSSNSSCSFMSLYLRRLLSPIWILYSTSASVSSRLIISPSFLMIIPSWSPIALKTFKISSSEAFVKSIGSSSSSSIVGNSNSSSNESSSSSNSSSIGNSLSSSSSSSISVSSSSCSPSSLSMYESNSESSSVSKDSFTNSLISSFIVEASIPFAFSETTFSKLFIWIRASSTRFCFSAIFF